MRHPRRYKKRVVHFVLPRDSKDSPNSEDKDTRTSSEWSSESLEAYIRIATRFLRWKMQPLFDELDALQDRADAAWKRIIQPLFDLVDNVSESFDRGCVVISVAYNKWVDEQRQRLQPTLERLFEITQPFFALLNQSKMWVEDSVIWKWMQEKLRETISPVLACFDRARDSVDRKYREIARPVFDQFDLDGDGELDLKELYAALCLIVATLNTTALSIDPPKLQYVKTLMKDERRAIQFDEFFDVMVVFAKNLGVRAIAKATVNALIPLVAFTLARNAQRLLPDDDADAFGLPIWIFEGLIFVAASVFCYFYLLPGMYPSVDALSIGDAAKYPGRARAPDSEAAKLELPPLFGNAVVEAESLKGEVTRQR